MPIVYLSPSTQEYNYYVNGGTEEEWMNLLADYVAAYLTASGIRYDRNTTDMTAAESIQASNAGDYDLHLALHSNAAPDGQYGEIRGVIVYYYPGSYYGSVAANLVANAIKQIYPLPQLVRAVGTIEIGEVRRVKAPAVFLELGYHDNIDDAVWIQNNLQPAARGIAMAVAEYFGVPFLEPGIAHPAVVDINWGYLNIRDRPSANAAVLARAFDGANLTVLNQWQNWYVVQLDQLVGWANADYITLI
ncbi:MAG: N-acetylmuramoyl-L-alanine amidase [Oscillospiraceae bacterium]|nr:N-acetylmuramoyl-L-alanine amidase [Oscillospiraceae bacterium]